MSFAKSPTLGQNAKTCCDAHLASQIMLWNWDSDVTWNGAVAKFHTCSVSPDRPGFDSVEQWERKVQSTTLNASIFGRTQNLYITDRCFAPRRLCSLRMKAGVELLLPRDGPGQLHIFPKKYDVVIGAAQVFGVVARTSFPTLLEQRGGMPFVNFGRGAAGPHVYTDPGSWPALSPIFARSRAVVICVMAGRSSPSSESGAFSGQSFGAEQLHAFDRVLGLERSGHKRHAERLKAETLANARNHYAELVRRIGARAVENRWLPPRILLVWLSGCPLSGCNETWQYPQYYQRGSDAMPQLLQQMKQAYSNVGAGVGGASGSDLVELVDASYGHLPPSPPLPIDQCLNCPAKTRNVCSSPVARDDGWKSGRLCGSYCGQVSDKYYPDDDAHRYAATVIGAALSGASPRSSRGGLLGLGAPQQSARRQLSLLDGRGSGSSSGSALRSSSIGSGLGRWVHLAHAKEPPYLLEHLHDAHRARVVGCSKRWPGLFRWGWVDSGEAANAGGLIAGGLNAGLPGGDWGGGSGGEGGGGAPRLLEGEEMCHRMRGINTLFIGDSLSLQLYDSWRARLRQARYSAGHLAAEKSCAGAAESGELPCEGFAPALCGLGPYLCNGGAPPPEDPGHGSLYAACDNGATLFMAQAYRWVLDVSDFTSSDPRGDQCAARVRADPLSFGLAVVPAAHVTQMVINSAWTPHGTPRRDGRRGARDVAVVVNQFAHVHAFVAKVMECYASAGIGETPNAPGTGSNPEDYLLAARDAMRYWSLDQGRWAATLKHVQTNLSPEGGAAESVRVRVYYRTSPVSCDAFCNAPGGAPRHPINASTLLAASLKNGGAYSHQLVFALNDMARSAFKAHGHGIIENEAMLGARVDAYPASYDGDGDKLHFCQPGPTDWAMDQVLKRVSADAGRGGSGGGGRRPGGTG